MRVLVVEDERKTVSFIRKALQAEGYAVDVCHNREEALGPQSAALQWIVSVHKGSISIEYEPGLSTTVAVQLPLAQPQAA